MLPAKYSNGNSAFSEPGRAKIATRMAKPTAVKTIPPKIEPRAVLLPEMPFLPKNANVPMAQKKLYDTKVSMERIGLEIKGFCAFGVGIFKEGKPFFKVMAIPIIIATTTMIGTKRSNVFTALPIPFNETTTTPKQKITEQITLNIKLPVMFSISVPAPANIMTYMQNKNESSTYPVSLISGLLSNGMIILSICEVLFVDAQ